MKFEELSVPGAWVCTPEVHSDDRGSFLEWFRNDQLEQVIGRRFDVVQANHSVSRRGSVRGVHFAQVPPGQAKFVYCPHGAVLDVIIDLRVGSPTFGTVSSLLVDDVERRAVFLAEGLGHAFVSLADGTAVTYLVNSTYDPDGEHTVHPLDPALDLPWPDGLDILMSPKDAAAPPLEVARERGLLPSWDACQELYASVAL
jgi:dTDP-4-dehydrorhamnose 3,5-epimerase